jgi:uncharacterized protein (TIGR00255 family)
MTDSRSKLMAEVSSGPPQPVKPQQRLAIKSMTGYAQARAVEESRSFRISIRAVNHRFLDLHIRVPEGFEAVEPRIRQMIRERVRRGHLDVTLHVEMAGAAAVGVNEEVAATYIQAAEALRKKFGIDGETDLATILRLPGVIGAADSLAGELAQMEAIVAQCLAQALDKLDEMRGQEARHLGEEMFVRLDEITNLASNIEPLASRARPLFAKRLDARLRELLAETPIDATRLAQEAAIAAERSDIAEELARLKSHVEQFRTLLIGGSDAGKKMDFLLQEMQREANTLLSKTPGSESEGLEITRLGLEIKSQVEKLREQVQNIE